ncbi:hypothetical protein RHGRI_030282 [Rhododendron griersonianum]|uniref:Uncharacterized protein n=1 Tax=Rhododendron griersonianum TaxID=479676 RepID=A0AAV6IQX5_9ERIC|nr:hypothetical protein RHGRI_030282 [Rhododendron griersonianum]
MDNHAMTPEGRGRPLAAAKPTNKTPAGISLNEETKNGPVLGNTSFIATIAVPQKKNGDTSNPHSHVTPTNDNSSGSFGLSDDGSSGSDPTSHSTSVPVPTQSSWVDGGDSSWVSLEAQLGVNLTRLRLMVRELLRLRRVLG